MKSLYKNVLERYSDKDTRALYHCTTTVALLLRNKTNPQIQRLWCLSKTSVCEKFCEIYSWIVMLCWVIWSTAKKNVYHLSKLCSFTWLPGKSRQWSQLRAHDDMSHCRPSSTLRYARTLDNNNWSHSSATINLRSSGNRWQIIRTLAF